MGSTANLVESSRPKMDTSWGTGMETALTAITLAAGLGNIMRLPRVVYFNGGGPFLVIYICITLIFGIPLVFLEMCLGQFCQKGSTKIWKAVPLLKGVGYVQCLASVLLSVYYPVFMAFSLFYLIWCGKGPLPFEECTSKYENTRTTNADESCFEKTILKPPDDDAMWFSINMAFLFLLWGLFLLCLFKNSTSFRKSTYFILLPLLGCLVAVLVAAIMRDPSVKGLVNLITFQWDKLLDISVWHSAVVQMLFSTHIGFGNLISSAGRIYPKSNTFWTAVSYIVFNLLVGLVAVCTVYLWIGQLERKGYKMPTYELPEVFAFTIIYTAASYSMGSLAQLWSALAFFVMICSGFASMVAALYTVLVGISAETDRVDHQSETSSISESEDSKSKWPWWQVAAAVCGIGFGISILVMVPPKIEFIHLLDHYTVRRTIMMTTILELIGFLWIYGFKNLDAVSTFQHGNKVNIIWKILLSVTPVLLLVVEIWSVVALPLDGLRQKIDPLWVYTTGWSLYLLAWLIVIGTGITKIFQQDDYSLCEKLREALKPTRDWGPTDVIQAGDWKKFQDSYNKTGKMDSTLRRRGTRDYTFSMRVTGTTSSVAQLYHKTSQPQLSNGALRQSKLAHDTARHSASLFTPQSNGSVRQHLPEEYVQQSAIRN